MRQVLHNLVQCMQCVYLEEISGKNFSRLKLEHCIKFCTIWCTWNWRILWYDQIVNFAGELLCNISNTFWNPHVGRVPLIFTNILHMHDVCRTWHVLFQTSKIQNTIKRKILWKQFFYDEQDQYSFFQHNKNNMWEFNFFSHKCSKFCTRYSIPDGVWSFILDKTRPLKTFTLLKAIFILGSISKIRFKVTLPPWLRLLGWDLVPRINLISKNNYR